MRISTFLHLAPNQFFYLDPLIYIALLLRLKSMNAPTLNWYSPKNLPFNMYQYILGELLKSNIKHLCGAIINQTNLTIHYLYAPW